MALECLQRLTVKSLAVHLSSSTVVLLLRVVSGAPMLVEEWHLNMATSTKTNNWYNYGHHLRGSCIYCQSVSTSVLEKCVSS